MLEFKIFFVKPKICIDRVSYLPYDNEKLNLADKKRCDEKSNRQRKAQRIASRWEGSERADGENDLWMDSAIWVEYGCLRYRVTMWLRI